jgi:hypothetical protein
MDDMDLDIHNYELEDILNLFHISYEFTESELKSAYKTSLKTHPDKSGLDPEIFRFFKKAYEVLSKIFYFRNRKKGNDNTVYIPDVTDDNHTLLLKTIDGKSVKDFNIWFNDMFEQTRVSDKENDNGYGEWYNSYKDKVVNDVRLSDFSSEFEKEKRECRELVVRKEISEICSGGSGYSLNRDTPMEYCSDVFSKLKYEDLKVAHTQTVVPVTNEDFEKRDKFKSVDEYKRHREQGMTQPISLQQSKEYLKERESIGEEDDTRRIFSIIKRDEEVAENNKKWWGKLQRLE